MTKRFGLAVKFWRESSRLTQEELAEKTGLGLTYISGIEQGKRNPSLIGMARLSCGLNVSLHSLISTAERIDAAGLEGQ